MRSLTIYIERLQRKGLGKCFCNLATYLCDPSQRNSRKLYYKYRDLILAPLPDIPVKDDCKKKLPVWVCWLQGIDNAPFIVKKCYASIQKFCADRPIHLITSDNMDDYVTLPDYVMKKYRAGIIPPAQFSDILRLALLVKYGGIWVDSTVLITDSLPKYITDEPIFFFSSTVLQGDVPLPHAGSNWLLSGCKENPVWQRLLELLCTYWKQSNSLIDYFVFHLFLYLLVTYNPQAKKHFIEMPHFCNSNPLYTQLGKPYSEKLWNNILWSSPVHKLTYKFKPAIGSQNTIYDYVLSLKVEDL